MCKRRDELNISWEIDYDPVEFLRKLKSLFQTACSLKRTCKAKLPSDTVWKTSSIKTKLC